MAIEEFAFEELLNMNENSITHKGLFEETI